MTETDSSKRPKEDLPPPPEPGDDAYITEEDIRRAAAIPSLGYRLAFHAPRPTTPRCPMLRLWALVTLLGVSNAAAQTRTTKTGDSVFVVIHHVRADKRAQYDSLMQNIWWPAAQRAGKKYPAYGKQIAELRRYAPTEMASDSTYTYLYLYSGRPDVPLAASGGNYVLAAAGFSKAQSDSFALAMRSYLRGSVTGPLVDEPYR